MICNIKEVKKFVVALLTSGQFIDVVARCLDSSACALKKYLDSELAIGYQPSTYKLQLQDLMILLLNFVYFIVCIYAL